MYCARNAELEVAYSSFVAVLLAAVAVITRNPHANVTSLVCVMNTTPKI